MFDDSKYYYDDHEHKAFRAIAAELGLHVPGSPPQHLRAGWVSKGKFDIGRMTGQIDSEPSGSGAMNIGRVGLVKPRIAIALAHARACAFEIQPVDAEKIAAIKQMHDHEHKAFRAIAAELGISKSQAQRLHGM